MRRRTTPPLTRSASSLRWRPEDRPPGDEEEEERGERDEALPRDDDPPPLGADVLQRGDEERDVPERVRDEDEEDRGGKEGLFHAARRA